MRKNILLYRNSDLSYASAIPAQQKGRSYVVTNAGWVAVDAGGVKAGSSVQGEMNLVSMSRTASTDGLDLRSLWRSRVACVRRNRVVLAVVATVKLLRRRHRVKRRDGREFREGDGGKKELVSGESAA